VPQHVDFFVNGSGFGDVGIGHRNVGFRLVVVVIADEVLDGVVGEKLPQLVTELRRQGFVVGQHQGRFANLLITRAMVWVLPVPVAPSRVW
jgi:hypothetical protein